MSTKSYIGRKVKLTEKYAQTIPRYTEGGKNEGIVRSDEEGNTRGAWIIEMDNGVKGVVWGPDNPEAECILLDEEIVETTQEPVKDYKGRKVKLLQSRYGHVPEKHKVCIVIGYASENNITFRAVSTDGNIYNPYTPDSKTPECILLDEESTSQSATGHTILDTAKSLIYGDREKEYGKAIDNIGNIAKMWSILLQKEVTMEQVVECMIAVKQCRLINQPNHMDSWIDICGYAALKEKINKGL